MLSDAQVKAAKPRASVYELDADEHGLKLRVIPPSKKHPNGSKSWSLRYRNAAGDRRRVTIGQYPDMKLGKARTEAAKVRLRINAGEDPAEQRKAARGVPIVADLVEQYLRDRVPGMKPSTQVSEKNLLEKHVLCLPPKPKRQPSPCRKLGLAKRKVAEVTKADVERVKALMRDTPGAANKVIGVLSRLFSYAEDLGWREKGKNPARGVKKNPEKKIERFLTPDERARLDAALAAAESTGIKRKGHVDATAVSCFRLLLWTGMRLGEALDLRWRHVDLAHDRLVLDDSKEKNRAKIVHLPAPAVAMLEERSPDEPDPDALVFSTSDGARLGQMQRRWIAIRDAAKLPGFRIHDCRHAWASSAVMGGVPLHIVGKALGHATPSTTNRYAHLAENVVAEAVAKVGAIIEADSKGKAAKVLPIKRRKAAR